MIGATLAAMCGSVLAGRIALRHGHPVELAMAAFMLACGLVVEIAR